MPDASEKTDQATPPGPPARRVSKVGSKLYWYGAGSEILAETNASGNTLNEYVFFGGKRVALLPAGSTAQYYVEDSLGTSRIVTTNTGVVCYDADFYPYGGERAYTDSCTQNNYKFEGKERDTETQNDDFGARYYSWRFGRWLSADWSNVPVPVPYANLTNPQTLNLYAMVADDPESFADLDGHLENQPGEPGGAQTQQQATTTTTTTSNQTPPAQPSAQETTGSAISGAFEKDPGPPPPPAAPDPANIHGNPPQPPPQPPLQYDMHQHVPPLPAAGPILGVLQRMQNCSQFTISSTAENTAVHPPGTPHRNNQAADLEVRPGQERATLRCAAQSGAHFGLDERAHPSAHSTGAHVHVQVTPGRNGGRGDLPPVQ